MTRLRRGWCMQPSGSATDRETLSTRLTSHRSLTSSTRASAPPAEQISWIEGSSHLVGVVYCSKLRLLETTLDFFGQHRNARSKLSIESRLLNKMGYFNHDDKNNTSICKYVYLHTCNRSLGDYNHKIISLRLFFELRNRINGVMGRCQVELEVDLLLVFWSDKIS